MRFLDLDLDFFLDKNSYLSRSNGVRLGSEYKPWNASKVRHFLEDRCGLSTDTPVLGRTIESHGGVLDFWYMLIESGRLKIPFEVTHIDAHPDLGVGSGLHIMSGFLYINSGYKLEILKEKHVHSGNYLTFAIIYGWVGSLIWIPLVKHLPGLSQWDGDERTALLHSKKSKGTASNIRGSSIGEDEQGIPFKVLPWHKFRTDEAFNYIALSRSPDFTPPESDALVTVIEEYMKQI